MKCKLCGSESIETDYEYELKFCRNCGTVIAADNILTRTGRFLDFIES